ncbi:MAG: SPOR domain-containing protein, partial [Burkholderiaceae bacterium]|nr:SPOR domain-containing protein [Burkholderiaceae bacterium]
PTAVAIEPAPAAAPPAPATGSNGASPAKPQPTSGTQLIQVAAVSSIARGRDLQRQLRAAGFDAYWERVSSKKGDVVRVRVAVNRATQDVGRTLAALRARGLEPVLVNP